MPGRVWGKVKQRELMRKNRRTGCRRINAMKANRTLRILLPKKLIFFAFLPHVFLANALPLNVFIFKIIPVL